MRNRRRGNVTVEFALSFGFLIALLTGCFQFGYAYYVYNTLENAVRAAARFASLRTYDSATETPTAAFTTAVQNMAVYGNPTGDGQPLARGLAPANVTLTVTFDRNVPQRVAVTISNYNLDAVFRTLTFNGKPSATFPYLGRWAPP